MIQAYVLFALVVVHGLLCELLSPIHRFPFIVFGGGRPFPPPETCLLTLEPYRRRDIDFEIMQTHHGSQPTTTPGA